MDEIKEVQSGINQPEREIMTKLFEYSDGSSHEIRIEKVEGGYIKKINKYYRDKDGNWKSDYQTSVCVEDPLKEVEKSLPLIEKIKNALGEL